MTGPDWGTFARDALDRTVDCPDDETLHLWVERAGSTPRSAEDAVGEHVSRCARCRLEAEEMGAFFAEPGDDDASARAIERALRGTLAAGEIGGAGPGLGFRPPPSRRRGGILAWSLAGAAVAASLLALFFFQELTPPPIPALDEGAGQLRGEARPVLLEPLGEQATMPHILAWQALPGESGPWNIRLERVDGTPLWSTSASATEVMLPDPIVTILRPGSRYVWHVSVAGRDEAAATGAFRILPDAVVPGAAGG